MAKSWKTLLPKKETNSASVDSVNELPKVNLHEIVAQDMQLQQLFSEREELQKKLSAAAKPSTASDAESRYLSWVPSLADKKKAEKERLKKGKAKEQLRQKGLPNNVEKKAKKKQENTFKKKLAEPTKPKSNFFESLKSRRSRTDENKVKNTPKEKSYPLTKTNKIKETDYLKYREVIKKQFAQKDKYIKEFDEKKDGLLRRKKSIAKEWNAKKKSIDSTLSRSKKIKDNVLSFLGKTARLNGSKDADFVRDIFEKKERNKQVNQFDKIIDTTDKKRHSLQKSTDDFERKIKKVSEKKDGLVERISKAKTSLGDKLDQKFTKGFDNPDFLDLKRFKDSIAIETKEPKAAALIKKEEENREEKRASECKAIIAERLLQKQKEQKEELKREQLKEQLRERKKDRFS